MGNDDLPFMPWYPAEFYRTTATWPFVARAAYRELLDLQWLSHGLPADPDELRQIIRCPESDWATAWRYVEPKFSQDADGLRRNLRLEEHREKSLRLRDVRSNAGRTGGKASGQSRRSKLEAKLQANPESKGEAESKPSSSSSSESSSESASSSQKAAAYTHELSKLKVEIRRNDAYLRKWIAKGVTLDRLIRVVAYIRTTDRCEKLYPTIIQTGYINKLLADQTTDDAGVKFMYELMRRHDEGNGAAQA